MPVRRKFINFYEKYQDLDNVSRHKNTSFVKLREMPRIDWRGLCENVLKSIDIKEKEEVLTGKTRMFMSVNFQNYLQELLDEKQRGKKLAMEKLAESIKSYVFAVKWDQARQKKVKVYHLAKDLLNTWNSKIEYIKFKKFLSVVKRMQLTFKLTVFKRHFRFYKNSAIVVGRAFKLYKIRKMLFNAKRIIIAVNKCHTKFHFRLFMARVRINKRILNDVFDNAWS